jgi:hypothetical protein
VIAQHSGTGATAVLKAGTPMVTLRGLPGEIVLYVFGGSSQARVELLGEEAAVSGLRATSLGA